MILIRIILSGITSRHCHYYILQLNYYKKILAMLLFLRGWEYRTLPNTRRRTFRTRWQTQKKPPHKEKFMKVVLINVLNNYI